VAARDDLNRHQRWVERLTAQAVSPSVSEKVDQRTQRRRISSRQPLRVGRTAGSLVKRRVLLSALGGFGISLLATALILRKHYVPSVAPAPMAPETRGVPQSMFVGQTVVKTSRGGGYLGSVVSPVRGPEAAPVAGDTLPTKADNKSKRKRPGMNQLPWQRSSHITFP
jgi:hypothetical protein